MTGKTTILYEGKGHCPRCHKSIEIRIERETVVPMQKAETETHLKLAPDTQTELEAQSMNEDELTEEPPE